jgi:hypothetical protein
MAKKKIKKAILAGLAAYAGSKMLGGKGKDWRSHLKHTYGKTPIKQVGGDASVAEAVHGAKHFRKPSMLGDTGGSMDHMKVPKKWYEFWKKHGGSVTTAKLGKMIKASQGTYAREDESIGMRLGAKKTKHDKKVARDESYGDWGKRKTDWAKSGKMIKAKQGTYAREDESLGMRLGKGKGTAKERDMSYGDWGKRKTDWAKTGKMVKARYGTEVRTDGSNPHVPKGGTAYVKTKLNGTLKVKTF